MNQLIPAQMQIRNICAIVRREMKSKPWQTVFFTLYVSICVPPTPPVSRNQRALINSLLTATEPVNRRRCCHCGYC